MSDVSREDLERCKSVVGKAFESQEISISDEQLEVVTKDIMGISFSHGGGYSSDIILGFTKGYIDHGLYARYVQVDDASRFAFLVNEVKSDIVFLLNHPVEMPSYMMESQLRMTLEELDQMVSVKNKDDFFPYYPKGITDSWDYNDKLGKKLMDVLAVYRTL